jgi:uncharacterized RDD family membrane protein YckC
MECRYCQAANADDEHRCRRCGRRLRISPAYPGFSAAAPVLQQAAAPVLKQNAAPVRQFNIAPAPQHGPVPVPHYNAGQHEAGPVLQREEASSTIDRSPEPSQPRRHITYQPSLFPSRELPLVVQFDTIAPDLARPAQRKAQPSTHRQRRRSVIQGQQALEFDSQFNPQFTASARSSKSADGVIYCDAPVAIPAHRAMAAAMDASIIVMALAVFGIIFRLAGGAFVLDAVNVKTAPMFLGVAAGVVIFYRLLWCLANGDTLGQKWTRLRLVNFDGQTPTRAQRFHRTASGFLSLLAGGIGLLWSLVDEDTLTWHDHISKTFPTPVN